MPTEDAPEKGLDPQQQLFLMGKVAALEQALWLVATSFDGDEQRELRSYAVEMRDNPEAMARVPAPYRGPHQRAWFDTFDRLVLALSDRPANDDEG